jgi:tRNA-Thr(GGU) m(6)t(6)A37 methyltransferase TsaA
MELRVIGSVSSRLTDPRAAPKQGDEGAPEATLEISAKFAPGLEGISVGDEVIVLTWLDRADREVLSVHPRDDLSNPETGVFVTRSADRPNPIGLHRARVLKVDRQQLRVDALEAIDGTPVLDIKPVLGAVEER